MASTESLSVFKLTHTHTQILFVDLMICLKDLFARAPPVILDVVAQNVFKSNLPRNLAGLVDLEMFSKVCGREITKIEYNSHREQHANSTERAWLRVRFVGDSKDTLVFAKCQAASWVVWAMMSIFDVYRNELHAYAQIEMPVKTAKIYGAKYSPSRFVLVMEDLSQKGVEFPNVWSKEVNKKLGQQVLTTLAKLHATFWGDKCPNGVWGKPSRPYQGLGMGMFTLYNVEKRCMKGLIPPKIHNVFMQALWHWREYRDYMDNTMPQSLAHCDTHMGNFYIEKDGTIGCIDFQVFSKENPMRDVAYFLSSSYDPDLLQDDEEDLIKFYLSKLEEFGVPAKEVPTFEEAWFAYRAMLFSTLYAWVFSGGAANLMDPTQTNCGVSRIVRVMERVDATGALYEILDGRVQ